MSAARAQDAEYDQREELGTWYVYGMDMQFDNSRFGIQGDYQLRFWQPHSDLEQVLLRTGMTYTPKVPGVMLTLGYGNITTGDYGESSSTINEHRVYQEALFSGTLGARLLLSHRIRSEQRWRTDETFRTRYRYSLGVNLLLNGTDLQKGVAYVAVSNEVFINGETEIGDGKQVEHFDRNRTYAGLGYALTNGLRTELGLMYQATAQWAKYQAQVSVNHSF